MLKIDKILISEKNEKYLIKRRLLFQYLKVTKFIINGDFGKSDLKIREPKNNGIYSFRINRQFRVFGEIKNNIFYVDIISNHQ